MTSLNSEKYSNRKIRYSYILKMTQQIAHEKEKSSFIETYMLAFL